MEQNILKNAALKSTKKATAIAVFAAKAGTPHDGRGAA